MRLAIRIFTVLALGAIGAAAAVVVTALQPVQYQSTSVLLIPGAGNRADNETVVRSLEALIVSPPVATDIAARAGTTLTSAQVIERLTVTRPPDSAVLEVSVLDTEQDRSLALARASGPALLARINTVASTVGTSLPAIAEYAVIAVNQEPTSEVVDPPRERNGVIGLGLGLLVGVGLAVWRPRRNRRIESEADAAEAVGAPLYATLPLLASGSWRANSLDVPEDELPFGWPPIARRMVVLGTGGRPSVRLVQFLASSIARSGRDVLLVDAEPEERGLTATFHKVGMPGFFDCIGGRADPVISALPVAGEQLPREMAELIPANGGSITFLPAGDLDVPPAALAGDRVGQVLRRLGGDVTVIVHGPRPGATHPVNHFVEYADAVLVPVVEGRTRVEDAQLVSRLIGSATAAPMFVILLTDDRGRGRSGGPGGRPSMAGQESLPEEGRLGPSIAQASTMT